MVFFHNSLKIAIVFIFVNHLVDSLLQVVAPDNKTFEVVYLLQFNWVNQNLVAILAGF